MGEATEMFGTNIEEGGNCQKAMLPDKYEDKGNQHHVCGQGQPTPCMQARATNIMYAGEGNQHHAWRQGQGCIRDMQLGEVKVQRKVMGAKRAGLPCTPPDKG
jgi:hypothetical protein